MEITESTVYWITRLDGINVVLKLFAASTGIASLVLIAVGFCFQYASDSTKEDKLLGKALHKLASIVVPLFFLFILLLVATPTTKEMCVIKGVPVIVNNESVQELPSDVVDLAHEWLEELRPKKD